VIISGTNIAPIKGEIKTEKGDNNMRKYKCEICGHIVSERWMRQQARKNNHVIEYTEPCPKCGYCFYVLIN